LSTIFNTTFRLQLPPVPIDGYINAWEERGHICRFLLLCLHLGFCCFFIASAWWMLCMHFYEGVLSDAFLVALRLKLQTEAVLFICLWHLHACIDWSAKHSSPGDGGDMATACHDFIDYTSSSAFYHLNPFVKSPVLRVHVPHCAFTGASSISQFLHLLTEPKSPMRNPRSLLTGRHHRYPKRSHPKAAR
jgi:hypothetical protein